MANEEALHRCVTEFMLDTCRYTASDLHFYSSTFRNGLQATPGNRFEAFSSGSSVEFYIKPMLSCIGDVDTMMRYKNLLAIPAGHTAPTELPTHFQRRVTVYEIIDSHQPGYVYLKPSYILAKNDKGCSVVDIIENNEDTPKMLLNPDLKAVAMDQPHEIMPALRYVVKQELRPELSLISPTIGAAYEHGPAVQQVMNTTPANCCNDTNTDFITLLNAAINDQTLSFDFVICMLCPLWPPQAADWPARSRIHGVPDQTTVTTVVNNGCDVVGAVHPSCRQDEWTNKHQWRLSFSRAEVTLLNNWTPVQQIIYHMLRFVMKREVLSKTNDNDPDLPKLSNYHIKTLMLWECEQKPPSWWSAESSLIKLCSSLLHKLSDWVAETHCEHYFIRNGNLIDRFVDNFSAVVSTYDSLEQLANESFLLPWFVENYICKCAKSCPAYVSALFEHTQSSNELVRAVHAVVDWKLSVREYELYKEYCKHENCLLLTIQMYRIYTSCIPALLKELQNVDLRLRDCCVAVLCLQVAYKSSIHSLTEYLLETLWMLFAQHAAAVGDTATSTLESGALLSISKAIHLARLSSDRSDALKMLYNEMSKAYLHHSFTYRQESTYCVVHVLLAVLYYKSGHYQSAIDHCKQVFNQCDSESYNLRCIGAEYLPEIDENVDAVFGLILLYQHVQREALKSITKLQPDTFCLRAYTTQLLARYLYSKSSIVASKKGRPNEEKMYRQHLSLTESPLLSDVMLFKAVEKELDECQETPEVNERTVDDESNGSRSMDTSLLVTTLELVALEKLITARQTMVCELYSPNFLVVNEFEALYAYKCGLFEECMKMCRDRISMFLCSRAVSKQHYPVSFPVMLCLLDGELVSLFGVIRLLHPSLFAQLIQYREYSMISMLTLLLYLIVRCHKHGCNDSIDNTMTLIRYVHDEVFNAVNLDRLILKLTYRSLKLYSKTLTDIPSR